MNYIFYTSYKDSGIEWMGKVPVTWKMSRLKFLFRMNPSKSAVRNISSDTDVSFLPMELVSEDGKLRLLEVRKIIDVYNAYTYCTDNDVIIAKITPCFENGKGAVCGGLMNGIGFASTEFHVLRPMGDIDSEFLFYITKSQPFRCIGEAMMTGAAGQKRVPDIFIKNFPTFLPPLPEQHTIATFLDRETSRIDALIDKKERLIALLKEKRQVLISNAVTKGLDPDVKMKDSGVEWIGEIPEHWCICQLRRKLKSYDGIKIGPFGSSLKIDLLSDEGFKVYGQENIIANDFILGSRYIAKEKYSEMEVYTLYSNDVIITMMGTTGKCRIVPEDIQPGIMDSHLLRIRPHKSELLPRYLSLLINEGYYVNEQIKFSGKGSIMQGLNSSIVKNIILALPPLPEQHAIASFLDRETANIDTINEKINVQIEKLREFRQALISNAVTGKIDVREEVRV